MKGVGCPETLSKKVMASVIRSKVSLSNDLVHFKKVFIYAGSLYDKNYFSKEEVRLSNDTIEDIYWKLDTSEIMKEKAFNIDTTSGLLAENEESSATSLKFFFTPNETKVYESKVYISIYDKNHKLISPSPYKEITLYGEGTYPRIYFDKREIIFPIVIPGFESKVRFKIMNEGYDNTKLTYRWFCQNGPNLKVIYLDGEEIGMLKNELRMDVLYTSNKPISFTGTLTFIDSDNRENGILVSGTCDNSLFSSFSFQQRQCENVEIVDENDEINLKLIKENETNDNGGDNDDDKKSVAKSQSQSAASSAASRGGILGFQKISTKVLNNACKYLKRYLNLVLPNSTIGEFPNDMMKDHGDLLFDFIQIYTGKAYPFKINVLEDDYGRSVLQIRNQYLELIKALQSDGAFLNTVIPEYLMEFKHYYKYIFSDKNTERLLQTNWQQNKKKFKKAWQYLNKESWIHLIYQILKIYYLIRVTPKSLKQSVKFLSDDLQNVICTTTYKSSNVYSFQELILLRWIKASVDYIYPNTSKKVINFSDDFLDGKAITSILLSYLPNIEDEYKLPKRKNVPEHKYNINNEKILEILGDFGVVNHMKPEFLSFPTAREMLLFMIMMFQNLQHFIPRDTLIFSCILGDTILKSVNLANNTKKRIDYIVKKEGSDDFNIESPHNLVSNEIKIDPYTPGGVDFNIAFKSRIFAPVYGKIYFISSKNEGGLQAAPLVFLLESKITSRRSIGQIYSFKTNMYKTTQVKFPVRSPIAMTKIDFNIYLYQKKKVAHDKKVKKQRKPEVNVRKSIVPNDVIYKVFFLKYTDESKNVIRLDYDSKF